MKIRQMPITTVEDVLAMRERACEIESELARMKVREALSDDGPHEVERLKEIIKQKDEWLAQRRHQEVNQARKANSASRLSARVHDRNIALRTALADLLADPADPESPEALENARAVLAGGLLADKEEPKS